MRIQHYPLFVSCYKPGFTEFGWIYQDYLLTILGNCLIRQVLDEADPIRVSQGSLHHWYYITINSTLLSMRLGTPQPKFPLHPISPLQYHITSCQCT